MINTMGVMVTRWKGWLVSFGLGMVCILILQWGLSFAGPAPHMTSSRLFYDDFRAYVRIIQSTKGTNQQVVYAVRSLQPYLLGQATGLQGYFDMIGAGRVDASAPSVLVQDLQTIPTSSIRSRSIQHQLNQIVTMLAPLSKSSSSEGAIRHALAQLQTRLSTISW